MKKGFIMLLTFVLIFSSGITAHAEDVNLGTVVPEYHTVTIEADGGKISANGSVCGDALQVNRHDEQSYWILPDSGKVLEALYYNGVDVTDQVKNGVFTALSISDDAELKAVFKDAPVVNSDKTYDITGTLTDENGNPISGVVVDIGGKTGKTDENGNFTVKDVPSGTHTVIITDENGKIIGHTQLTIRESDDSGLTLTTDENGIYVIKPESSTNTIVLDLKLGDDGVISIGSARDASSDDNSTKEDDSSTQDDSSTKEDNSTKDDSNTTNDAAASPQTGNDVDSRIWLILLFAGAAILPVYTAIKKHRKT